MPIRFRCAYCNQLMSIARRKGGTVVSCPTCGGQVVVPQPEAAANAPPQPEGGVFEEANFEEVFQQPAKGKSSSASAGPAPQAPATYQADVDVEPVSLTEQPHGCVLTIGRMILLAIVVILLLGLAFLGGFLIGKSSVGQ